VPLLVAITPRRSQGHGYPCITRNGTADSAAGRIFLLLFHLNGSLYSLKLHYVVWVNSL
jgi:hypothetical protein